MVKGKSAIECNKTDKKSAVQFKEKLTSLKNARKQTVNKVEAFDGVDSLVLLKDTKERKKHNDIDERILHLKSELKSLISDRKSGKDCGIQDKDNLWNLRKAEKKSEDISSNKGPENLKNFKEPEINEGKNFKPSFSSTPCKFTEWLDTTINETSSQCQSVIGEPYKTNSSPPTLELETTGSTFNRFPISNKVEELLYKSLVLKNCGVHLSDLLDSNITSETKINPKKSIKCKEACTKSNREKPAQRKTKQCKVLKRGKKKRLISLNSSHGEVEVINLDNTSVNSEIPNANLCCIDEDISIYDWDEPFDINGDSDDVQILNESETKDPNVRNEGIEPDRTDHRENPENSDINKTQAKNLWECPICLEHSKGQEVVATQCGHVFCRTCIESHMSRLSSNCPTCRADLTNKPFITLFNF